MENEFLKNLWQLRFEKMKKNEEEAAWAYQEVLDLCLVLFGGAHPVIEKLQTLVKEERMHEKLAEELIEIGRMTHPECGGL